MIIVYDFEQIRFDDGFNTHQYRWNTEPGKATLVAGVT